MKNFKPNSRFYDRKSGRSTMHKAVCSECGQDCEVPFKPTGDKPVFCSNCFRGKDGNDSRGSRRRDSRGFNSGEKKMFEVICNKCGKECEVPFRPTGDKPVYCSQCFDKGGSDRGGFDKGGRDKGSNETKKQFEEINKKLDTILQALITVSPEKVVEKKITVKKKVSKVKSKKAVASKKAKVKKKKK